MRTVVVLPRNMHFGPLRATAIDLCVRDFVAFSPSRAETLVVAEAVEPAFEGIELALVPRGSSAAAFAKPVLAFAPDIVLVQQHRPTAIALARRLRDIPVVLHRHGLVRPSRSLLRRWLAARDYERFAGLVGASGAIAQNLRTVLPRFSHPVAIVHNGLDLSAWTPRAEREEAILFAGRLAPEKGVLEAATAIAGVLAARPGWRARFLLADGGRHPDYAAAVRAVLADLGGRVEIRQDVPHAEVKAAFESAAIGLVPSVWAEPFGRTALEAFAGGAALVTSGRGGLREVVGPPEENAAWILPRVDHREIGKALLALIDNPAMRQAIADTGRARAERLFEIRDLAGALDGFLARVVANHAAARPPASKR